MLKYAAATVPRYTSYPTAPYFTPDFPKALFADWLAGLDPAGPISVYLHVPFCAQQCWYCGCNMKLAARYAPVADYIETLLAEIDLVAAIAPAGLEIAHLHWGGGTPTVLAPEDLARVMDRIGRRFAVAVDAEIAVEADPRTLRPEMIAMLGRLGFNRASFGVQEFDPAVQAAINRIQPPDMVARCVDGLRAAGVGSINFDLIYGLPHQTEASLVETVELCAAMAPDRVALFGYAHVPWMAKNQRMIEMEALPCLEARVRQLTGAAAALAASGLEAVGIDHFAKPADPLAVAARAGTLRRNFQGYTADAAPTLLGFGATAIGRTAHGYVQTITETGAYSRAVRAGELPIARGLALTAEDRLRAEVIESIMCGGPVDTAAIGAAHGAHPDWCADDLARLAPLAEDGLLAASAGRISLTPLGRKLARVVAGAFDARRRVAALAEAAKPRHAVAV